jgi:putative ABC transport system permease protein
MLFLWQDLRYGFRGLRATPGFTVLAILTLSLGIGAATTMFSVIQNVLIAPFPYKDADRIVAFSVHNLENPRGGRSYFQPAEFLEYQNQSHVFEDVIGGGNDDILLTTPAGTEQFDGGYVTPNTFAFLGVPALRGRTIVPDDAKPGAPPVFVMAYKMWLKRFQLDPSILGKSFILNGTPTTLIGIMPKRFTKRGADIWISANLDRTDSTRFFVFQARIKRGVTYKQVAADLMPIAQRLAQIYPKNYPKRFSIVVEGYAASVVGPFQTILTILGVAVGLLLLIACANVANMLLARSTARDREIAIRTALGASQWRIVRALLVESLILSVAGAALGCLLAFGGIKALVAFIPDGAIPREAEIRINTPALLFSLGFSVFTALLFGLAPALQTVRRNLVEPLKDSGRGISGGFRRGRLRNALVVVELALSLLLLTGAGLLMRTLVALETADLGFNPANLLVARLPFPNGQFKSAAEKQRFFAALLPRLQALPGVLAVAQINSLPPFGGPEGEIEIPGKTHTERWQAMYNLVSDDYLRTLGLRLLRGRALQDTEMAGARKVAMVNQTLVRKYFGNEDPLGRQVRLKMLESVPESPVPNALFEIVGVVSDTRNDGVRDPVLPEVMLPYTVTGFFTRGILVRTAGPPMPLANSVRREIWAVNPGVAIAMTRTLNDYLSDYAYAGPRFGLVVMGAFAAIGLALVAIGVYSVIAYTVSRQTHEIGIRMALGAGRTHVLGMVLRMGFLLIGIGMAIGLVASFAATRVLANQLEGISPHDPLTFVSVSLVIALAGLAACWFPAMRAARVDPMIALRFE